MPARILIVEDEPILALNLKETLQDEGFAIVGICHSGDEAIKVSRTLYPEIVLMDIKLDGEMPGTDAAQFLSTELNIPVVFLTSYLDDATLEAAYQASPFGYLQKPYRPETLTMTLKLALSQHKRQSQMARDLQSLQQNTSLQAKVVQLSSSASYQVFSGSLIRDGASIDLTQKEKLFLDLLAQNSGQTVSFAQIYLSVWNTHNDKIQALRTLLHRLRLKSGGAQAIESIHEQGYQLKPLNSPTESD